MTPTEFCQIVESRLGWMPPDKGWRTYMTAAAQVKRKISENPRLYTWDNLLAAVALLARERTSRTPVGVFAHVERAVTLMREDDSHLDQRIQHACAVEAGRGDPEQWLVRFARATGAFRHELIDQWESANGASPSTQRSPQ